MLKSLCIAVAIASLIPACDAEQVNRQGAAVCADLVVQACSQASRCGTELGDDYVSSSAGSAMGSCDESFSQQAENIYDGCMRVVNSGTEMGTLIVDHDPAFLSACMERYECNERSLDRLALALDRVMDDALTPEPVLETSMGACYFSGPKSDDPRPDPEPEQPEPEPEPEPEPQPEPEPDLTSMPWNIVLQTGIVANKKADGGNWDCCTGGNAPDVKVDVTVAGTTYVSDSSSSLTPQWDELLAEDVLGSDITAGLTVKLSDTDPGNDDTIGECEFAVGASSLGSDVVLDCPRDEDNGQAGFTIVLRFE